MNLPVGTVHLGVSPAGIEWNVYPKEEESPEEFAARVEIGRNRLAELRKVGNIRREIKNLSK